MDINYEVQPQTYPPNLHGELILAKSDEMLVGRTGYVPWNFREYAQNGLNNARMKIVNSFSDIEIDQSVRRRGVGLGLLDKLLDELMVKRFDLLIITQPDSQKRFYMKVFRELSKRRKIASYRYEIALGLGNVYEVKIEK